MKILLVNLHSDWGGAENVLIVCAESLINEGYTVSALIPAKGELFKRCQKLKGLKTLTFADNHLASILLGVYRVIKNNDFDVVILNNQRAIALAPLFKIMTISKIVGYEHTPQPNKLRSKILDTLINTSVHKYICVSKYMIKSRSASARSKCVQIYNGFKDARVCNKQVSENTPLTFGVLSIFRRWKGQLQAIEALYLLKQKGLSANLVFIGGADGADPSYFDECKELAVARGLQNQIEFLGFQTEPLVLMSEKFDVLLQPSISPDPLPTTVIEALMFGLPIIGYNSGGINEMIFDDVNGFLISSPNYKRLADAMETMISHPEKIDVYGKASRTLYEKNFTRKKYSYDVVNQLKSLNENKIC